MTSEQQRSTNGFDNRSSSEFSVNNVPDVQVKILMTESVRYSEITSRAIHCTPFEYNNDRHLSCQLCAEGVHVEWQRTPISPHKNIFKFSFK